MNMIERPRRLRKNEAIRRMSRETRISADSLILPIFVDESLDGKQEISSMPGQFRYSISALPDILDRCLAYGVTSILLFGIPKHKDEVGSSAWEEQGIVQEAIRFIKAYYPALYVITDVCLCEYTSHGHCGVLKDETVDNDATLGLLGKTALSHAKAGADMVAPSDMMDGRVGFIRASLDAAGYSEVPIMAYSAKYASAFYGPFREAADSAPQVGNRQAYQMDYHNAREAVWETALDVQQGADVVMVKPALSYLDVIAKCRAEFTQPVCAYSVSGEYSMIKSVARAGLMDEHKLMCETAVSIFRSGADILITYYALELAQAIDKREIG